MDLEVRLATTESTASSLRVNEEINHSKGEVGVETCESPMLVVSGKL